MKFGKVLFLVMAICFLLGAQAQAQPNITKGTLEIGNTVGFDYSKSSHKDTDDEWTITMISLQPRVGYFFTPNISAEGILLVNYVKFKETETYSTTAQETYETEETTTNLGFVGGASYHFVGESNIVPYVVAGLGFLTNSKDMGEYEPPEDSEETSIILPVVGGGIKILLSDHLGIRMEAMYMRITNADGWKDYTANDISIHFGLTGLIGQE